MYGSELKMAGFVPRVDGRRLYWPLAKAEACTDVVGAHDHRFHTPWYIAVMRECSPRIFVL